MFRTLMRRAALSVITVAAAMVLIPPGTAHADTVDYPRRIDAVRGDIVVHNDTTSWLMVINRKHPHFKCGYAKIIIDRNNRFDPNMQSPKLCNEGDSITWSGVVTYSNTRSARFYMCQYFELMPDSCEYLQWIPKR